MNNNNNNNDMIFDIKYLNYSYREVASYSTDKITMTFKDISAFEMYKTNVLDKHATWSYQNKHISKKAATTVENNPLLKQARIFTHSILYYYDHAGKPRNQKKDNNNDNNNTESSTLNKITRKRTVAPSIKVGCLASYKVSYFVNGEIEVVYNWKHKNHDPANPQEYAIESRLSPEIKKWIEDAVEKFNDWKSIKALLRLSEHELDVLETNPIYNRFPPALLINYHDVQNVISRRLNLLSRKRYQDSLSVQLWISYLKEKIIILYLNNIPMVLSLFLGSPLVSLNC
ncbi:hypothetical protein G6F43_012914 [Rhizopus delemar]|nr:hypothetical protein G6F43_012914 [Rhizopus delemar]